MTEEDYKKQLKLHGFIPWTLTIADALESGMGWEKESIIRTLRNAQAKIDELTIQLKENHDNQS